MIDSHLSVSHCIRISTHVNLKGFVPARSVPPPKRKIRISRSSRALMRPQNAETLQTKPDCSDWKGPWPPSAIYAYMAGLKSGPQVARVLNEIERIEQQQHLNSPNLLTHVRCGAADLSQVFVHENRRTGIISCLWA